MKVGLQQDFTFFFFTKKKKRGPQELPCGASLVHQQNNLSSSFGWMKLFHHYDDGVAADVRSLMCAAGQSALRLLWSRSSARFCLLWPTLRVGSRFSLRVTSPCGFNNRRSSRTKNQNVRGCRSFRRAARFFSVGFCRGVAWCGWRSIYGLLILQVLTFRLFQVDFISATFKRIF